MNISATRSRWAAVGAAVAVSLGAGGIGITHAVTDSGEKPVYIPLDEPCRLADNRPAGIGPDTSATFDGWGMVGDCDLPTGTAGLAVNVTAVGATQQTNLRFYPADAAVPGTANLNPTPGAPPIPNAVNVTLDDTGKFKVYNRFGTVSVVIDVMGVYDDHNHDDRYYQKSEADAVTDALDTRVSDLEAAVAPLVNSVAAFAGGDALIFLAGPDEVVQTVSLVPPADGIVVVNSSMHFLEVDAGAGDSVVRCSITDGATVDFDFLQIVTLADGQFHISSGTRGFNVTEGNLLTVNLVCNESSGQIRVQDPALTAIFAPT